MSPLRRPVAWILATGLMAAISLPALGQLTTSGNGPYYATPSWDQKITTGRFVVLANWNNEAVLDRETGLVWEKAPTRSADRWSVALHQCLNAVTGGRSGWRLPGIVELMSLMDRSRTYDGTPFLPSGHPFTVQTRPPNGFAPHWSATSVPDPVGGRIVRIVDLITGALAVDISDTGQDFAWCVRGGAGGTDQ